MNVAFYIARRYFFAKKSTNVINLISLIALTGVAFGTAALIVVLSVFNGFVSMSKSMLNAFNPDLKIIASRGKTFSADSVTNILDKYQQQIQAYSKVLEENALIEYEDKQYIGIVKGVDNNFTKVTGIDTMMLYGKFELFYKGKRPMAVVGSGIAYSLGVQLNFLGSLKLWLPRPNARISLDITQVFNRTFIFPSGIFSVHQQFDDKYVFVPLSFLQEALELPTNRVSAIEVKLKPNIDQEHFEKILQQALGERFIVKNRFEQEEMFYRIIRSERLAVIIILSFIIIIASFNVIGTLSMLIIDKKQDIETLRYLGASKTLIQKIFTAEGALISGIGIIIGLLIGIGLVLLQYHFGIVKFPSNTSLMYIPYPVILKAWDILLTIVIVGIIGFFASRIPVKYFINKYFVD
jgi:lipoprotein-releasing system permease protein